MIASANAIFSALCCAIHKKFTFGRQQKKPCPISGTRLNVPAVPPKLMQSIRFSHILTYVPTG